jgi:catechol 2,3-dioxygenase-like lactoylglutathione lyase family enzyme
MAESMRLGAAVVFVTNLARSVRFYTEVLGLSVVHQDTTAALLGGAQSGLVLRAAGENAAHALGSVGVQYLVWVTDSEGDLERRADMLRRRSAYRETRTADDRVTVEGRDPDDQTLMLCYLPAGQAGMREIPLRAYAW